MSQAAVEENCQKAYKDARDFFAPYSDRSSYCGFKILQGPPIFHTPLLIVAYQPGGNREEGKAERDRGCEDGWMPTCAIAHEPWPLSRKLQAIFSVPFLERCVGMNAIFWRSPGVKAFKGGLSRTERAEVQDFCKTCTLELIQAIDPKRILIVGFGTQELFSGQRWPAEIKDRKGKDLIRRGQGRRTASIGCSSFDGLPHRQHRLRTYQRSVA
jgi:hypothetical protein